MPKRKGDNSPPQCNATFASRDTADVARGCGTIHPRAFKFECSEVRSMQHAPFGATYIKMLRPAYGPKSCCSCCGMYSAGGGRGALHSAAGSLRQRGDLVQHFPLLFVEYVPRPTSALLCRFMSLNARVPKMARASDPPVARSREASWGISFLLLTLDVVEADGLGWPGTPRGPQKSACSCVFGGVFAQRAHSANYYGDYPGNNPENHPPCGIMHNQFKTQKFKHLMLAMGPRDLNSAPYSPVHCSSHSMTSFQSSELTELPVVENSQLFAQRAHSACTAHGTPPLCGMLWGPVVGGSVVRLPPESREEVRGMRPGESSVSRGYARRR